MKFKIAILALLTLLSLTACGKEEPKDPQLKQPKEGDRVVILETDMGTIKMKIFTKEVPELSKNFLGLAKGGKYDNVPFHRVMKDFMIQSGDFTNKDGTGGYSYKGEGNYLANELNPNLHHHYGTVSMAKTDAPVSIGSQFFIVTNKQGEPKLDGNYSPIGQVYEGMDVAEKIADLEMPPVNGKRTEKPSKIVNIKKATVTLYTE
jgi:peptidyl-prolyl cis-trans isomerase B (cyclophilin B)